jgi:2-polyprenyl-6-methoxyphenol hydroxylase-like FAD-dependent oxidoreductase
MQRDDAPVLIAGGGLVGLSAAAFLARQGLPSLTVERLPASSPLPRAAFFHMRTLELFRELGIEQQVIEGSARDFVPDGAIIARESLAGRKLGDIIGQLNAGVDALSPCRRLFLNQPNLEPILRERARAGGATVLQGTEILGLSQDDEGVALTVREGGGPERLLRGKYLIAADGGHSRVRELLGIGHTGRGAFSHSVTIYFTADLRRFVGDNAWSLVYVNNAVLHGFFRLNRAATAGFLAVNIVGDPAIDPVAAANAAADVSESRLIALLHAAIGDPDVPVRIDGCSRWRATASVADRFRQRRVFIAGDAAHLMPPTGGFGGNTGIQDAHNLAWKLACVLRGEAGDALLDSYETERQPVCRFIVEQAFSRYVARTAPWLRDSTKPEPLVDDFRIELGTLYGAPDQPHVDPRSSSGQPGSRLPHFPVNHAGHRRSTIDLTGGCVLLVGRDGTAWLHAAHRHAAVGRGPALQTLQFGAGLQDAGGDYRAKLGITHGGAVLVRPDGHIAWRWPLGVARADSALASALDSMLRR